MAFSHILPLSLLLKSNIYKPKLRIIKIKDIGNIKTCNRNQCQNVRNVKIKINLSNVCRRHSISDKFSQINEGISKYE